MNAKTGEYIPKSEPPTMPVAAARFRSMEWVESLPIRPPEASVLLYLAHRIDENLVCWPSRGRIAEGTKLSERSISRALAVLETMQILQVVRERGRRGHLRFKEIKLLIPESFGNMKTVEGDPMSQGPSATESKTMSLPKDSLSQVNIQYSDKYSKENEIEDKKSAIGQADCIPFSGVIPEEAIGEGGGGNEGECALKMTENLESQLKVGLGLFLQPVGCTYVHENDGSESSLLLQANRLVVSYFDACSKGGPKARVALWHLLGRIFYPHLPRFSAKHHLTASQCKYLHQIFNDFEGLACPVLATAFADWDQMVVETVVNGAGMPAPSAPDLEFIQTNLNIFRSVWFERFLSTSYQSQAELEALVTRLGYSGLEHFCQLEGI